MHEKLLFQTHKNIENKNPKNKFPIKIFTKTKKNPHSNPHHRRNFPIHKQVRSFESASKKPPENPNTAAISTRVTRDTFYSRFFAITRWTGRNGRESERIAITCRVPVSGRKRTDAISARPLRMSNGALKFHALHVFCFWWMCVCVFWWFVLVLLSFAGCVRFEVFVMVLGGGGVECWDSIALKFLNRMGSILKILIEKVI